jgi:lipopolysaccharide transport system ATP-binding protein
MHSIRQQGRTIFFVSHSMSAVMRLCRRVLLLHEGSILGEGDTQTVVNHYLSASWNITPEREWLVAEDAPGNDVARLSRVRVLSEAGVSATDFDIRSPIYIEVVYDVLAAGHLLAPQIELYNEEGVHVFCSHDTSAEWRHKTREVGRYASIISIPGNMLAEGMLRAHISIMSHVPVTTLHAQERNAVAFQVLDREQGDSARGDYIGPIPGVVRPLLDWTTRFDTRGDISHSR